MNQLDDEESTLVSKVDVALPRKKMTSDTLHVAFCLESTMVFTPHFEDPPVNRSLVDCRTQGPIIYWSLVVHTDIHIYV